MKEEEKQIIHKTTDAVFPLFLSIVLFYEDNGSLLT